MQETDSKRGAYRGIIKMFLGICSYSWDTEPGLAGLLGISPISYNYYCPPQGCGMWVEISIAVMVLREVDFAYISRIASKP